MKFTRGSLALAAILAMAPLAAQTSLKIACAETSKGFIPLLTAIYAEIGVTATFEVVPGERAIQAANAGTYDGDVGRTEGSLGPYPNLMFNTEPMFTIDAYAYVKKGSPIKISAVADLKKYKLGYVRGVKLAETLVTKEGLSAESVADELSLKKMLDAGRIDVALGAPTIMTADFLTVADMLPLKLIGARTFTILNKKHADLIPKVDAAIRTMKADGRFAKLFPGK